MPARLVGLTTTAGDYLEASSGLTIIVGPNNVGKSICLNELYQDLSLPPGENSPLTRKVIASYEFARPSIEEVETRLSAIAPMREPGQHPQGLFSEQTFITRQNQAIARSRVNSVFGDTSSPGRLGEFVHVFVTLLPPEARSGNLGPQQVPDLMAQVPASPMQILWANRDLEAKVAGYARRAFGFEVTVNRHAGANIRLHIDKPTRPEPAIGVIDDYAHELFALPEVIAQGHGVQAFLGIVVTLITATYDVVLIDEPEAFLHPPQARLLGEVLVELSQGGSQVVVATHSDDFLQGALRAAGSAIDVTVARLTRPEPSRNALTQVKPQEIRDLYEDPLLRYSQVLSGIFYRGTVLCEAESDCKYYSAVLDAKYGDADANRRRPDLLFASCGGKDRFSKAVSALQKMKTPTAIVADIDMLSDQAQFRGLFEQLGGDWASIETPYAEVKHAMEQRTHAPLRVNAKPVIEQVFAENDETYLTDDEIAKIRTATKSETGWSKLKEFGKAFVPNGPATTGLQTLLTQCKTIGLFLVEEGELEGWHRQFPRANKSRWLRQVFESKAYETSGAIQMLEEIVTFIESQQ